MPYIGFGTIKKDVNEFQRAHGMIESDRPAWIIWWIGAFIALILLIFLVITQGRNACDAVGLCKSEANTNQPVTTTRQLCPGFFQTVYSNAIPLESDVINLCNAGTLRLATGNIRLGGADRGEKPYNGSIEVLMVLNLISRNLGVQGPFTLEAVSEPKPEDYLLFLAGTEREITTSGRTFLVRLYEINREPSAYSEPYFSYHFSVNEK